MFYEIFWTERTCIIKESFVYDMNYSGVCFPFVLKTCAMMDVDKQNRGGLVMLKCKTTRQKYVQ